MIAFYLLVAIMPFVRHSLWNETKFAGLTLNKYLGILCLVIGLANYLRRHRPVRLFKTTQSRLFLLFGLVTMASFSIAGPPVDVEVSPTSTWVSLLLLFFVASALIGSTNRLRYTLLALVGGVAYASLHTIKEWINGGMMAGDRPGWVTGDPNYFALSALLCLPLGLLLAQELEGRAERAFCWLALGVTLFAFTIAGSRGAFFGLIASFLMLIWHSSHRRRYLVIGTVLLAVLLVVAPTSPVSRLLNPNYADQESTDVRTALQWAGLAMFEDHAWTGIGVGNYKFLVKQYGPRDEELVNVAHNTYLEVAAELGIVGIGLFSAIFVTSLASLRRVGRDARSLGPKGKLLSLTARGLEAGLIGGTLTIVFLSALHVRILWFVIILSMCLPRLIAQLKARPSPPAVSIRILARSVR